ILHPSFTLLLRPFSTSLLFFFLLLRRPPRSTLFPYTTLFRSSAWSDPLFDLADVQRVKVQLDLIRSPRQGQNQSLVLAQLLEHALMVTPGLGGQAHHRATEQLRLVQPGQQTELAPRRYRSHRMWGPGSSLDPGLRHLGVGAAAFGHLLWQRERRYLPGQPGAVDGRHVQMDTAGSRALLPSPEIQTETVVVGAPAQTRFGQGAGMPLQHQLRPQSLVTGQPLDGIFQQQLPGIAETDGQGASATVPGPLRESKIRPEERR